MKLLVVSEGKHELYLDAETSALVEMLRRMIPRDFVFERRKISDKAVQQVAMRGKSGRHEKRLVSWMRYAERRGFAAVVIVVDEDGVKDRRTAVANVQENQVFPIPRAIGIAIRSFDAWMLADEVAISHVLQRTVQRQQDPERISDPKQVCRSFAGEGDVTFGIAEFYLELAAVIDVERLAERCGDGFAPFRERVRSMVTSL
ncbi:MAG: hypothetical protein AB7U20_04550 [Planctomycetaceae bacterium]